MLHPAILRRRLRSGGNPLALYAADGYMPALVADFANDKYLGTISSLDDFTFGATSNATVIDSDGALKWRAHNLIAGSETGTPWQNIGTSDSDYVGALPPGVDAAITVEATAGTYRSMRIATACSVGDEITTRFALRAGTHRYVSITQQCVTTNQSHYPIFDLTDGVISRNASGGLYDATMESLGDGWYLCSVTGIVTVAGGYSLLQFASSGIATDGTIADGQTFHFTGARVFRSDLGGMQDNPFTGGSYVPATSAAVYLPRFDYASGARRLLIEPTAATNMLTHSKDFTNSDWVKTQSVATMDAVGPDGVSGSAATLKSDNAGGTGTPFLDEQGIVVSLSTAHTFSIFAKSGSLSGIMIFTAGFTTPGNVGYYFDLENGTVAGAYAGGTGLTPLITEVGNGWYRCSITFTAGATDPNGNLQVYLADVSGVPTITVPRDGTSSILVYGAQFEVGSVPTSYIPTSGSFVIRAEESRPYPNALPEYTDGVTIAIDGEISGTGTPLRWYADANNYITHAVNASGDVVFTQAAAGTVDDATSAAALSVGVNTAFSIAGRHGSNVVQGAVGGAANTANTTPTSIANLSAANLQLAYSGGPMRIKSLRMWATPTSEAAIEETTA